MSYIASLTLPAIYPFGSKSSRSNSFIFSSPTKSMKSKGSVSPKRSELPISLSYASKHIQPPFSLADIMLGN